MTAADDRGQLSWPLTQRSLDVASVVLACVSCQHAYEPSAEDWNTGHTGCPRCGGWTMIAEVGGGWSV